jgi:hypothetical protein
VRDVAGKSAQNPKVVVYHAKFDKKSALSGQFASKQRRYTAYLIRWLKALNRCGVSNK